jgi:hypothetical protein
MIINGNVIEGKMRSLDRKRNFEIWRRMLIGKREVS